MEYDQMKFSFQHSSSCGLYTSFIGVSMLVPHGTKKPPTTDMVSSYELFGPSSYVKENWSPASLEKKFQ